MRVNVPWKPSQNLLTVKQVDLACCQEQFSTKLSCILSTKLVEYETYICIYHTTGFPYCFVIPPPPTPHLSVYQLLSSLTVCDAPAVTAGDVRVYLVV